MALTACTGNLSTEVLYNNTAYKCISDHVGETISICGYMSVASPMDGTYAYIMDQPLSGYPMSNYKEDMVTDTVVIYPKPGSIFVFTEKCIRVTGVITLSDSLPYNWYLADCSYEAIEPNDAIRQFNAAVDNGSLGILDTWLSAIYEGLNDSENAKEVSSVEYETKLLQTAEIPAIKNISEGLAHLTTAYNEWVTAGCEDDTTLNNEYSNFLELMSTWLSSLKVKGTE